MDWPAKTGVGLLFWLALAIGPGPAAAADVTLYELIENMSMARFGEDEHRLAWAALAGTARPSTLLCPLPGTCTVHATATSSVNVATGEGTFRGEFTVVVPGDNDVDGPEAAILTGTFSGAMDFSPALRVGQPYGRVVGTMTVANRGEQVPFTGIFQMPFVLPGDPSNTPLYLQFTGRTPNGTVVPVRADERALGRPTVKFQICLEPACGFETRDQG